MDIVSYLLGKNASGGGGGGSDLDWTAIGYNSRPQAITDGYNHAKEIKDNWTPATSLQSKLEDDRDLIIMPLVDLSTTTNIKYMFRSCNALIEIPLLDTSNVSNINNAFANCYALKNVPILNTSSVTNFTNAFTSCYSLTNKSLDNILQMCINATSYTGTKTLQNIGFNSSYYPASRIQALTHYQDFLDAGWTIGY